MSFKLRHLQTFRLLALTPVLLSRLALAQPEAVAPSTSLSKADCAQAFEEAQRLRNASRYLNASREALQCANPSCGAVLSEECGKIYSELQDVTPSVVFAARDGAGREVASASAEIDDGASALSLDGKPIPIDPGSHTFRFSADGFAPQSQSLVIRAGEKLRPITVVLQPVSNNAIASPTPAPSSAAPPHRDTPRASVPLGVYVLGGVAAIGVGGFAGFRWSGSRDFDELARTCKPDCSSSSVDAVRQKYLLSTISLAVGGAAAIAAVTWYVAAKPSSAANNSARVQVWSSADGVSARLITPF
jgi:hypothetical protein